jgi:toxin ParE1/3/4
MKKPVFKSKQVDDDTAEQADFIAQDNLEAAIRYLQAVDAAMKNLASFPEIGQVYQTKNPRCRGLRWVLVPEFKNYLIFYFNHSDRIQVVRVLHGARNIVSVLAKSDF